MPNICTSTQSKFSPLQLSPSRTGQPPRLLNKDREVEDPNLKTALDTCPRRFNRGASLLFSMISVKRSVRTWECNYPPYLCSYKTGTVFLQTLWSSCPPPWYPPATAPSVCSPAAPGGSRRCRIPRGPWGWGSTAPSYLDTDLRRRVSTKPNYQPQA